MAEAFRPLKGITVLAWEQAVSLPMATRLMADLGATVIRLESHVRTLQSPRHMANDLVRNKLSLALDLRDLRGQALFRSLAGRVDVVCENFTPRVKRQFDLTHERLAAERPDLIMLSLSGYGQSGAWSERPTYGPGIEAASGQAQSMGYPDHPPTRPGTVVFADNITGFYAAFAVTAALHHRRATGEGRCIDLSMYEANAFHLAPSIARSSLSGRPEERRGNADPAAAIQDVLPARGSERWLAVTVMPGQEQRLARAIDTPVGRDLASALREWVAGQDATEAASALQAAGIAAAPVMNARDVLTNEHLRCRGAFTEVTHDQPVNGYGAHPHGASPWRFVGYDRPALIEAPAVGQDSRAVLTSLLAMPEPEVDALVAAGVVGVPGSVRARKTSSPTEQQIRRRMDWRLAAGHDPDPGAVLGLARQNEAIDLAHSRS